MPSTPFSLPQLEQIRIASPCGVRWEEMTGDDVRRHCAHCDMQVTNLSAMSRAEAEAFLESASERGSSGRVCVRLYRRADGTVLTRDCPVGVHAARVRLAKAGARVAALLGLMGASAIAAMGMSHREAFAMQRLRPVRWLAERFNPQPPPVMGKMIMGDMGCPPRGAPVGGTPTPSQTGGAP